MTRRSRWQAFLLVGSSLMSNMVTAAPQMYPGRMDPGVSGPVHEVPQAPAYNQDNMAAQKPSQYNGDYMPAPELNSQAEPSALRTGKEPVSFGMVLFPGYEPLDVMGPLQILFRLSMSTPINLSLIAAQTGSVSAQPPAAELQGMALAAPQIIATHTFANAPKLDMLMVPGGWGMLLLADKNDTSIDQFVQARFPELQYLLSVCTGAISLAKAGVLKGKKATTNKSGWSIITKYGEGINWVPTARWTEDGKVWTSSGVAAGIDMTYAFFNKIYGPQIMKDVMNDMEYAPHTNPNYDPFSVVFNVPGAVASRTDECPQPL
ncbi:uncharacterized protein DFL_009134 [Arthrobotrys flagrans]|uniref:DJ-1/PfpI domain-containing protein n=1 Tax=Arthrobotrys flagrans TaxID=97331 RepID=A0A436ZQT6_ARTFL|nr:hypothetical protein DFL_009134 [Arthrobotrys flagrans]